MLDRGDGPETGLATVIPLPVRSGLGDVNSASSDDAGWQMAGSLSFDPKTPRDHGLVYKVIHAIGRPSLVAIGDNDNIRFAFEASGEGIEEASYDAWGTLDVTLSRLGLGLPNLTFANIYRMGESIYTPRYMGELLLADPVEKVEGSLREALGCLYFFVQLRGEERDYAELIFEAHGGCLDEAREYAHNVLALIQQSMGRLISSRDNFQVRSNKLSQDEMIEYLGLRPVEPSTVGSESED